MPDYVPISKFKQSEAYVAYSSFPSRPKSFPVWPKNENGQFVVRNGELFCQYEVKGALCTDNRCWKNVEALSKHIKSRHDPAMVDRQGLPNGRAAHQNLIDFYTQAVAWAKESPPEPASISTAQQDLPATIPRNAFAGPRFAAPAAHHREIPGEGENEDQGDDDEDDGGPAVAAASTPSTPALDYEDDGGPAGGPAAAAATRNTPGSAPVVQNRWSRATDQPTSDSLTPMILRKQKDGAEKRRKWLEDNGHHDLAQLG